MIALDNFITDIIIMADNEVGQKRKAEDETEVKVEDDDTKAEGADEPEAKKIKYAQVKLGPKKFDTPEEMIKYFSFILNNMTVNQDMNDYEFMVVDECLRRAHPEAEKKIGCGIKTFQIRTHPEHDTRCYSVVRTDGSCEDFSYRKCVEKLFPGYTPPTRSGHGNSSGGSGGRGAVSYTHLTLPTILLV